MFITHKNILIKKRGGCSFTIKLLLNTINKMSAKALSNFGAHLVYILFFLCHTADSALSQTDYFASFNKYTITGKWSL